MLVHVVQHTDIEAAKIFYVIPVIYGRPYSQTEIPLPYVSHSKSSEQVNLG